MVGARFYNKSSVFIYLIYTKAPSTGAISRGDQVGGASLLKYGHLGAQNPRNVCTDLALYWVAIMNFSSASWLLRSFYCLAILD